MSSNITGLHEGLIGEKVMVLTYKKNNDETIDLQDYTKTYGRLASYSFFPSWFVYKLEGGMGEALRRSDFHIEVWRRDGDHAKH